jgi:WD40 repeat protein
MTGHGEIHFPHSRSLAAAALALAIGVFLLVWTHTSRRGMQVTKTVHARAADHDIREPATDRVVWRQAGIIAAGLEFSPDERYLTAILYKSGEKSVEDRLRQRVMVIDSATGTKLLDVSELRPLALSFRSDNRSIAVLAYDIRRGRQLVNIYDFGERKLSLANDLPFFGDCFLGNSVDGRSVALQRWSEGTKETYLAWDAKSGESIAYPGGEFRWAGGSMSPDGELWLMGGRVTPCIHVFQSHAEEGQGRRNVSFCHRAEADAQFMPSRTAQRPVDDEARDRHDRPEAVSFTPDSKRLLIVYGDGTLIDYRIADGMHPRAVQIGTDGTFAHCVSVALSPSGKHLAYSLEDGSIRLARIDAE